MSRLIGTDIKTLQDKESILKIRIENLVNKSINETLNSFDRHGLDQMTKEYKVVKAKLMLRGVKSE
jgi:hypothetical protein